MNKISDAFNNKKAFIPFVTAGDPDLDTTKEILFAMQEGGADLIEIGIPFSDPVAEGPVIQEADLRALEAGTTTDHIFDMVLSIKDKLHVPVVFMTYINPIYVYGTEKFARRAKECGAAGVIVPDVPFEEKHEILEIFHEQDLEVIYDRANQFRESKNDRSRGRRICVLRKFSGSNGYAFRNQYRHCLFDPGCKIRQRDSMCHRIWNLHTGAGKKNGGCFRRSHRRQCHRKNCGGTW